MKNDLEVNSMFGSEIAWFDFSQDADFCFLHPDVVNEMQDSFDVLSM